METALKETYGLIVYQEQAMQIARDMAGYTLGRADFLRKAMAKKQPEVMAEERRNFVDGAVENGIEKSTAEEVFGLIEYFGGYAFNKSHSAGYAVLAFQEAYLKVHYPVPFMAALLSNTMSNTEEIVVLINECRKMGIEVLPPDVNSSDKTFVVEGPSIRFGLCAIKNVGQAAVESIVEARKEHGTFEDVFGLCEHIDLRLVNKRVLESLIQAGACDSLEGTPGAAHGRARFGHRRGADPPAGPGKGTDLPLRPRWHGRKRRAGSPQACAVDGPPVGGQPGTGSREGAARILRDGAPAEGIRGRHPGVHDGGDAAPRTRQRPVRTASWSAVS